MIAISSSRFSPVGIAQTELQKECSSSKAFWLIVALSLVFGGASQAWAAPPFRNAAVVTLVATAGGTPVTSVPAGTVVSLTATVTGYPLPGQPNLTTGQVDFCTNNPIYNRCEDAYLLGTAQRTSTGIATYKFIPGPGVHSYHAEFRGTNAYTPRASDVLTLAVTDSGNPIPAAVILQASGTQGNYTLTAAVTASNSPAPTGAVSFQDTTNSNYQLAAGSLAATGTNAVAFRRAGQTLTSNSPVSVALADFNGDGIPDLVSVNANGSTDILLGKGDGTFTRNTLSGVQGLQSVVTGDFDSDGNADFAVSTTRGIVTIYLGNGDGTFRQGQTYTPTSSRSGGGFLASADFNGDGVADLAVTTLTGGGGGTHAVNILLGNGDGTFTLAPASPKTADAVAILTTDLNRDGKADLVVANGLANSLTVLLGNGDGSFAPPSTISTVGSNVALASADLNGDGVPDLVVEDSSDPPTILLGQGDGTFTALAPDPTITAYPYTIGLADVNGDGIPDLILPNVGDLVGTINIYLGRGDGTFSFDTSSPAMTGYDASAIAIADFDGDGRMDFALGLTEDGPEPVGLVGEQIDVWTGLPFTSAIASVSNISPVGTGEHYLQANYSGDGNYAGGLSPLVGVISQRVPTTLALSVNPTGSTFGQAVTLNANLTPFTAQNHSAGGLVTFMSGSKNIGTGSIVNGVATLTTTTLTTGYDNLRAVYAGDTNFVQSSSNIVSFLVTGGPPQIATSTALSVTAGGVPVTSVVSRTLITLTATVTAGGNNLPAGQVNFCDATAQYCTDIHLLGTAQVANNGVAFLKLVPTVGSHTFKAVFVANTTDAGSTSASLPMQVSSLAIGPTINTLVATGQPGNYTLTSTVNGRPNVLPTGVVAFADTTNSNYPLGAAPLVVGSTGVNVYLASSIQTPGDPQTIVTADFNNDGIPDVAVSYYQGSTITIFLGKGDGTFTNAGNLPQSISGQALATGDFNADGCADLAFPSRDSTGNYSLSVLLGRCDGTFAPASKAADLTSYFGYFGAMGVADLNGDGKLDLAMTVTLGGGLSDFVVVLLGNGDGTFSTPLKTVAGSEALGLAIADFNSDGHPDIVLVNIIGSISFLFGNGDGTFSVGVDRPIGGSPSYGIATADFNGDGKPDLVITDSPDNRVLVLLGNGDGTFTPAASPPTGNYPYPIVVADFNGDGIADFAVGNYVDGTATIMLGNGNGTFTPITTVPQAGAHPAVLVAGDYNSDGVPDLLFGNASTKTLTTLLAASQATATITGVSIVGTGTHYAQASYPGDSANLPSLSNLAPLTGQPVATTTSFTVAPATSTYGLPVTLTATVVPTSAQSHAISGNVTFSSGAALLGSAGISSSGNASITTTALVAGIDTLTATYNGDNNFSPSSSTSVLYQVAAANPVITFAVPDHTYGDPSFAVAASSNSQGTFTYSVVSGPATISGSIVTLHGAGQVVLQVSQAASGNYLAGSQTATFTVKPVSPTITFTVPNHTYGDTPFSLAASSNSSGAFTYSVVTGQATISGAVVTLTGAGPVVVQANQAASGGYAAGTATASFTVSKEAQTISFAVPASPVNYGAPAVTLLATSSSGLPVSFRVLSGPGTISGNLLTTTGAGTVLIGADQVGNSDFLPAAEVTHSIVVVGRLAGVGLSASPDPVFVQNPVTLTATLTAIGGIPSGKVTFLDGTTQVSNAIVSGNIATVSLSTLAVGTHSITAVYSGDATFVTASSPAVVVTVQDFGLTVSNPEVTIAHGGTATYSLMVSSIGGLGMASTINFSVSGAPDQSQITFTPSSIPTGVGTTPVTLTIHTPNYPVGPWNSGKIINVSKLTLALVGFGGIFLPFGRKRRTSFHRMQRCRYIGALLIAGLAAPSLVGCGSGWATQRWTVTVTAKSGQLSRSIPVILISRCANGASRCPVE